PQFPYNRAPLMKSTTQPKTGGRSLPRIEVSVITRLVPVIQFVGRFASLDALVEPGPDGFGGGALIEVATAK
ncbi:MAG: hypothetical protein AAFU55_01765, partial [Pseudomonadota bacterium]